MSRHDWFGVVILALLAMGATFSVVVAINQHPNNDHVTVYVDSNGCEYLMHSTNGRGGITPRLQPNGRPICHAPAH